MHLGSCPFREAPELFLGSCSSPPFEVRPSNICSCRRGANEVDAQHFSAGWTCVCSVQLLILQCDCKEDRRLLQSFLRAERTLCRNNLKHILIFKGDHRSSILLIRSIHVHTKYNILLLDKYEMFSIRSEMNDFPSKFYDKTVCTMGCLEILNSVCPELTNKGSNSVNIKIKNIERKHKFKILTHKQLKENNEKKNKATQRFSHLTFITCQFENNTKKNNYKEPLGRRPEIQRSLQGIHRNPHCFPFIRTFTWKFELVDSLRLELHHMYYADGPLKTRCWSITSDNQNGHKSSH